MLFFRHVILKISWKWKWNSGNSCRNAGLYSLWHKTKHQGTSQVIARLECPRAALTERASLYFSLAPLPTGDSLCNSSLPRKSSSLNSWLQKQVSSMLCEFHSFHPKFHCSVQVANMIAISTRRVWNESEWRLTLMLSLSHKPLDSPEAEDSLVFSSLTFVLENMKHSGVT